MIRLTKKKIVFLCLGIIGVFFVATLAYHQVGNSLTDVDIRYIPKYIVEPPSPVEEKTYAHELDLIIKVQHSVLRVAPENPRIPYDKKRELKQLYEAKAGACFDRSRVIEKILRYYGFKTRHVFILSKKETHSTLKSLVTPGISSHAVTEVLTKKGWLVVDSNDPWVSTDTQNNPISMEEIRMSMDGSLTVNWNKEPPNKIYHEPFTFIYGLYSRHGHFYYPYNFIPDVNYKELAQNFL